MSPTPGPWKVIDVREPGSPLHYAVICSRDPIGTKSRDIASVWLRGGPEKTLANANLIAAAPELLVALSELADIVQGVLDDYGDKARFIDLDSFTLQPARAAIAKATAPTSAPCSPPPSSTS